MEIAGHDQPNAMPDTNQVLGQLAGTGTESVEATTPTVGSKAEATPEAAAQGGETPETGLGWSYDGGRRVFGFKRNGEIIRLPEDEVGRYIAQGYDYTQKAQRISEIARALEEREAAMAADREELIALRERIKRYEGDGNGSTASAEENDEVANILRPHIEPLAKEIAALKSAISAEEERRADERAYTILTAAHEKAIKKYPTVHPNALMALASYHLDDRMTPEMVEAVFMEIARDLARAQEAERQKAIDEALRGKAGAPAAAAGGRGSPAPSSIPKEASVRDLRGLVEKMLAGGST